MNRSPAEIRDRWLNYGRRHARYPTLWDSSLAFASGPLAPEAGTLRDYSGRTAGATWSVGAGDVPKYEQGSVRGGSFWACRYDGTDDHANIGDCELLNFVANNWTVSTWFFTTPTGADQFIASKKFTAAGYGWSIRVNTDGRVRAGFRDAAANRFFSTTDVIADGTWRHVAWTVDRAATQLFFVGGIQDITTASPPTGSIVNADDARIGQGELAGHFSGRIAFLFVHRRVLTPNETSILARHPLSAYTVDVPRYWSFAPSAHLWPWQIRRSRRVRGHR